MNDIWFVLFTVACVVCTGVMKYLVAQQAVKSEFDAQKEWDRLSRAEVVVFDDNGQQIIIRERGDTK